ncbi:adenylyl-sulfate kinase [Robiginitalea sp. SC105]|uniref:adenylyl-sulfate kinase n=1 Tax=Robiginitalea sp. SC105 TaxID=2762332 RepID=UPI00163A5431|nr:adenylyl-sulfate kinase [Robiginitalea sp. SC105]MBC2840313.1 adenylyl-sulfate kinase [Robiginitalea sp. SC105]
MSENITPHTFKITRKERREANGHNSLLIFFTGLSGSGKSTLANGLEQRLFEDGYKTYVLDGDNVRTGLNKNLGFSPEDRSENIRRIGELAKLFIDSGTVVLAAFVAPYASDRQAIRELVGSENYIEVFVNTSLAVCEERDVKGLYAMARKGEIKNMTGVSAPYEAPENPDVEVSHKMGIEDSVTYIYTRIKNQLRLKQ